MQMQGERRIAASREDVWLALNDPEVLMNCIPGCDELAKTSGTTFEASVLQKVGPVKARFKGAVELSDIVRAERYTISGEGKGGAAGFAKGLAHIQLIDDGDGTLLSYQVEAKVGGKLAQLGNRLIDGFARKMADDFFGRFQLAIEGPPEEEAAGDVPAEQKKKSWLRRLIGRGRETESVTGEN